MTDVQLIEALVVVADSLEEDGQTVPASFVRAACDRIAELTAPPEHD